MVKKEILVYHKLNSAWFHNKDGSKGGEGVMKRLCLLHNLQFGKCMSVPFNFEKSEFGINNEHLKRILVDWRNRMLICNLYMNQGAVVRVSDELSEPGV